MIKSFIKPFIFLFVLFAHVMSSNITQTDSELVIPTALSIINEGNLDLNEFEGWLPNLKTTERIDGKLYSLYPIGESIISIPVVYFISIIFEEKIVFTNTARIERLIGSMLVAASSIIVLEIMLLIGLNITSSIFIVLVFAFSTSSWSTASRALSQHGPTTLFIFIAIWVLVKSESRKNMVQFLAIPVALSYLCNTKNLIFLILITVFILLKQRTYFNNYILLIATILLPFFAMNIYTYGQFLSNYYVSDLTFYNNNLLHIIPSLLVSPNRGFFFWHPVFIFSFFGIFWLNSKKELNSYDKLFIIHFISFTILIASSSGWWGSHCIGPRIFTDMVPYGIYFLGLFIKKIILQPTIIKRTYIVCLLFISCIETSIHGWASNNAGSISGAMEWNSFPKNIDNNVGRIWDFRDIQFLRGTFLSNYSYSKLEALSLAEQIKQLIPVDTIRYNTLFPYVQFGQAWWQAENGYIYNRNKKSVLFFRTKEEILSKKNIKIRIKLRSIAKCPIKITVNDYTTTVQSNNENLLEIELPTNCLKNDFNMLLFEVEKTTHLSVFDNRDLSFALYYITLK